MPEGDTLHTLAKAMAPALVGAVLRRVEVRHLPLTSLVGRTVERVWAQGKNLLVQSSGLVLRTHLGMYGSWHRYAPGERWGRSPGSAEMVLGTDRDVFVCFRPSEAESFDAAWLTSHPGLAPLGPDLCEEDPDFSVVMDRARKRMATPGLRLSDLLLDQTVSAGIGNVIRCEVLFLEGLSPEVTASSVSPQRIEAIYRRCARILRHNVGRAPRLTVHELPSLILRRGRKTCVHGQEGRPCLVCSTPIRSVPPQGDERATWWCPTCQKEAADP